VDCKGEELIVTPDLIRGLPSLQAAQEQGGSRLKAGMTVAFIDAGCCLSKLLPPVQS
jgi:hypothetical protein